MNYLTIKLTHEYYNIVGYLPAEHADQLVGNWKAVGADVETHGIASRPASSLVELKLVSGIGRCISIWVAVKSALVDVKQLVELFDREVIYLISGFECARFDRVDGKVQLRKQVSALAEAA